MTWLERLADVSLYEWLKLGAISLTFWLMVGLTIYIVSVVGAGVTRTDATAGRMEDMLKQLAEVRNRTESNHTKVEQVAKKTDKAAERAAVTAKKTQRIEKVLKPILDNPALVPALVPALMATPEPIETPTVMPDTNPKRGGLFEIFR